MKKQYILPLFLISSFGLGSRVAAQTNTSPYSVLGIGDLQRNNFDRSQGMGNAGMSLSSGRYMYLANPASLAGLDDHWFTAEVSANFKNDWYESTALTSNVNSNDIQFQKLNFGIKATKFWGTGFGLKQFSAINYNYTGKSYINGTDTSITATYKGSGGLNQVFWSNGFKLGKHFYFGIESSYIFGSRQESKVIPATTIGGVTVTNMLTIPYTTYYNHLMFKGGLQYHGRISNDLELGLGATATPKTKLNGRRSLDVISGDASTGTVTTTLVSDTSIGSTKYTLPLNFGGGLSLKYKDKYTFALDYDRQNWSSANNSTNLNFSTANAQSLKGGIEIANRSTAIIGGRPYYYEKSFVQVGAYYNQSYMVVSGQQLNDRGITFGMGFNPAVTSGFNSQLGYIINASIGQYGTKSNGLVRQTYFNIGVTITYRDFFRNTRKNIYD